MLILARKPGESIRIGDDITVTVQRVNGSSVKLAVSAPAGTRIMRTEILRKRSSCPVERVIEAMEGEQ